MHSHTLSRSDCGSRALFVRWPLSRAALAVLTLAAAWGTDFEPSSRPPPSRAGAPTARHAVLMTGLLNRAHTQMRVEATLAWLGGADAVDLYVVSEHVDATPVESGVLVGATLDMDAWLRSLPSFVAVQWLPHTEREFYAPSTALRETVPGWPYARNGRHYPVEDVGSNQWGAQQLWKQDLAWRLMSRHGHAAGHTYRCVVRVRTDFLPLAPHRVDLDASHCGAAATAPIIVNSNVTAGPPEFVRFTALQNLSWPNASLANASCPRSSMATDAAALAVDNALPSGGVLTLPTLWRDDRDDFFVDHFALGPAHLMELYFTRIHAVATAAGSCGFLCYSERQLKVTLLMRLATKGEALTVRYDKSIIYCIDSPVLMCGAPVPLIDAPNTVSGSSSACDGRVVRVPPQSPGGVFVVTCADAALERQPHELVVHRVGKGGGRLPLHELLASDGPACASRVGGTFDPRRDAHARSEPTLNDDAWLTASCSRAPCCALTRCLDSLGCAGAELTFSISRNRRTVTGK